MKNFKANPKQKSNYQKILSTFEKRRNKDWLLGNIQSSPRLRKSHFAKKP